MKRKIRLKKISFEKIRHLYDYRLPLPEDYGPEQLQALLDTVKTEKLEKLNVPLPEERDLPETGKLKKRLKELPCEECEHLQDCHTVKNKRLKRVLKDFHALAFQMEGMLKLNTAARA